MFRYSICDPLKPGPIEMGEIDKRKILDVLDAFPWDQHLANMKAADEYDLHFSPSLEFENTSNKLALNISIVEEEKGHEFYIFYSRPKQVKKFFGLVKFVNNNYTTDRTGQTIRDVRDAVTALINDDIMILEKRWG